MNITTHALVPLQICGLKAAMAICAQDRRESVSTLIRRAASREIERPESVFQLITGAGCIGASRWLRVNLSIRLTPAAVKRLAFGTDFGQASRDSYRWGLITCVLALTTGASRAEEIVELINSNAELPASGGTPTPFRVCWPRAMCKKQWPAATSSTR